MEDYEDSNHVLVATVDCTSDDGRPLCEEHNVEGFPTIKYGDPADLWDYEGPRDYGSLKSIALDELEPNCSPDFIHLCNRRQKEMIEDYMTMDEHDLDELIDEAIAEMEENTERFDEHFEELRHEAERLKDARDRIIFEVTPTLKLLNDVRRLHKIKEKARSLDQGET
jgi:hypothetical protein